MLALNGLRIQAKLVATYLALLQATQQTTPPMAVLAQELELSPTEVRKALAVLRKRGLQLPWPPDDDDGEKTSSDPQRLYFALLAEICALDPLLNAGYIARTVKQLRDAGYTPEDLRAFQVWWQQDRWRQQHMPTPSIRQLLEHLPRFTRMRSLSTETSPTTPVLPQRSQAQGHPCGYEV